MFAGSSSVYFIQRLNPLYNAGIKTFKEKCDNSTDKGEYPLTLEALVPVYIESIPTSKYTIGNNSFKFINNNGSACLLYVHLPPYGRPTYSFNDKKWTYID